MAYRSDAHLLDYQLFQIEGIDDEAFRSPTIDFSEEYITCLGAAQTFGRFCGEPFPLLLGKRLGIQSLNLGVGAPSPALFTRDAYLSIVNRSRLVVVQVFAARSESNRLFVQEKQSGAIGYRIGSGKRMRIEAFFRDLRKTEPVETVEEIIAEMREKYLENMAELLRKILVPKILFWFSVRPPAYVEEHGRELRHLWGAPPQLINAEMVEMIKPLSDLYVECVSTRGRPHLLGGVDRVTKKEPHEFINFPSSIRDGKVLNWYYPSPEMHVDAARALEFACRRFLAEGG